MKKKGKHLEMEKENEELRMLLRKLSHEMGNALTLLGGSIYYLEHEIEDTDMACSVSELKGDYQYICSLFSNLREYNHCESEDKRIVYLKNIAEEVVKNVKKMPGSEGVKLVTDFSGCDDKSVIYADITKIRQAFINVVKNSMEAMEDNSEKKGKILGVKIEKVSMKDINRQWFLKKISKTEYAHIEISDNGKGIEACDMENVFKPMFTTGKKEGTGLGLAVVKRIIENHDGKIKAVSAKGTGTAIHIYIPVVNAVTRSQTTNQACEVF